MCLAELIARAWGAASSGHILEKADVVSHTESSLGKKVETGTSGMGRAGNRREENKRYYEKHDAIVLSF